MKTNFLKVTLFLALAISMTSCKDKADKATTSEAETAAVSEDTSAKYIVNASESIIHWKGFKPTKTHTGTINVENGVFKTSDGNLQSGTFLIDMKSIKVTDLEAGKGKESLESHLMGTVEGKEGDFFNVNEYATAAFEITGTEAMEDGKTQLSGNLKIKDEKHKISFPVTISSNGDNISIESEPFSIDRTTWGVNFGSKSVFDNLGDKFINDDIELKIVVKASQEKA